MTETKCKMEEDHRIFAERPCSYGYLFWCTGIHKQTYQLLVFLVLNQRYLQIYVLVSRLPVWLLESCDLERGEKDIAIFLILGYAVMKWNNYTLKARRRIRRRVNSEKDLWYWSDIFLVHFYLMHSWWKIWRFIFRSF